MVPQFYLKFLKFNFLTHPPICYLHVNKIVPLKFNIPTLDQTFEKYMKYIQPLVSSIDYDNTKKLINNFLQRNGEGELLQKLLQDKADKSENWLSEWWTNVAYLDSREPIVINSNPGIRLPVEKFSNIDEWIKFSVNLLTSILKYKLLIDSNMLSQEYLKNEPLCMNQYYTLFHTCRIPGKRSDKIFSTKSHLMKAQDRIGYIVVVHKNRFFKMDVIDSNTQNIYSKTTLFRSFCNILDLCKTRGEPIGLMTAENRNVWGTSFLRLHEISVNREFFSCLHKSILLFCLDNPVFTRKQNKENLNSSVARNMLHGDGHEINSANRWFDKTIQVIVSSDGACGMNYEHTPAEAPPLLNIIDYSYKDMQDQNEKDFKSSKSEVCGVTELKISLDKKSMEEIDHAKANIDNLVNDLELHALTFTEAGKSQIKNFKISPDAFIQIGIQLGYFDFHKGPGSTYESGSLRRFKLGRTDTIRSCSPELVQFCKSFEDPNVSFVYQKQLLLTAIDRHVTYTKEVLNGQGIDRHLLGLKLIAIENKRNIPEIFMDTSFIKAFHHVLSTSQGSSSVDLSMCFGPLVPDGYGFCYNLLPDKVNYCISAINSSPGTNALSLSHHIEKAWKKIINILNKST